MKKVFIFLGHECKETLSCMLADSYESGARKAGYEVRRMNIGDMHFDPLLHEGYKVIQQLEPDLKTFQENIKWADHIVIVHPVWWSTVPALLKGLFDRAWLPAFAYRYGPSGLTWKKLLKGRSARIVMLQNSPRFVTDILFGRYSNFLKRVILGFAGISPIRLTKFTRTEHRSPAKIESWKRKIYTLGKKGI